MTPDHLNDALKEKTTGYNITLTIMLAFCSLQMFISAV
jgi:hypothetical protein